MKNKVINQYERFQINVSVLEQLRMIMFSGYIYVPGKTQFISGFRFFPHKPVQSTHLQNHIINLVATTTEKKSQGLTVTNFTQYKNQQQIYY